MADATDKPRISFITIATLHNRGEARPIVAILAAAGIRCLLTDESEPIVGALAGGRRVDVKVQVSRQDVSRALDVLSSQPRSSSPTGGRILIDCRIATWRRFAQVFVAIIGTAGLLALLL